MVDIAEFLVQEHTNIMAQQKENTFVLLRLG